MARRSESPILIPADFSRHASRALWLNMLCMHFSDLTMDFGYVRRLVQPSCFQAPQLS
jgi:hypothetical protein